MLLKQIDYEEKLMKYKNANRTGLQASASLVSFIFLAFFSINATQKKKKTNDEEMYYGFLTMSEVCHSMRNRPFRKVDVNKAFQEGIKAMVASLDAHSAYLPPKSYKNALQSAEGKFPGIGVSIIGKAPNDDALVVVDVVRRGPAEKAGVLPKDRIVEVAGEKTKGLSTDEVISKLKGPIGTKVTIKVVREDKKPHEFTITRDIIKNQTSACYYFPDYKIHYMSLKIFSENSATQMKKLLKKVNQKNCNGIILDLRSNPGGVLESAVDMASLFLKKGSPVVITKNRSRETIKTYATTRHPIFDKKIPIVVSTNSFTASAAEILGGCLRHYSAISQEKTDNLLVFLVGTPTFGKGTVQEVYPLKNGRGALKMTTMAYYLPDDSSIQAKGISPDFLIQPKTTPEKELKWINELYGKESALKNHITQTEVEDINLTAIQAEKIQKQAKNKPTEKEKSWEEKHRDAISRDVQIKGCMNLINMLNIAKNNNPSLVDSRPKALAFLKKNFVTDEKVKLEEIK